MHVHRLRLASFRQFDHADVQFGPGVFVLTGGNNAGKSTLVEAILWALFGAGAVRGGEASLRPVRAPRDAVTSAVLDFTHVDAAWRITRTLQDGCSSMTLYRNGLMTADSVDAAASAVTSLLGTREEFMQRCVTGRRELQELVQLRPRERLRALARLLGAVPPSLESPLDTLQREITESDERLRTLQNATDLLAQYTPELERARADLAEAERDAERLHHEWAQKRQDVETRLAAYRRRADEITRQIERLSAADGAGECPTCRQPLQDGAELLASRLDDEIYTAAQDIKWLAQRQTQLAQTPPDVSAADTRRARLRELVADRTERVARCEQAMQELWTVATDRRRALIYLDALRAAADAQALAAIPPPEPGMLQRLSASASEMLSRVTAYDGIVLEEDGRIFVRSADTTLPVTGAGDEELIALALRLAIMQVRADGDAPRFMILDEPFGAMSDERHAALLQVLATQRCDQLLVLTAAPVAGAVPLADLVTQSLCGR